MLQQWKISVYLFVLTIYFSNIEPDHVYFSFSEQNASFIFLSIKDKHFEALIINAEARIIVQEHVYHFSIQHIYLYGSTWMS